MMDSEGVSTHPREESVSIKQMPKLVRLEGRSIPRNCNERDIIPTNNESKRKEDMLGSGKFFDTLENQRRPYRRTHEEIEDFVAKRQRKTPAVDRSTNLKPHSYSTDKTDIPSIDKQNSNGYDPPRHENGKSLYRQRKDDHERGYDYSFGRGRVDEEDNELSRVNFIPGSSNSKLLNDRTRDKYLQPFSSSVRKNGSPSDEVRDKNYSLQKGEHPNNRLSDRSLNPMSTASRVSPSSPSSDYLRDRDLGAVNVLNRYDGSEHEKVSDASSDSNIPLNLQKTFSKVQGGVNSTTNTTCSATLTMIRPNSSSKSSPASTVSSASSLALLDSLNEGSDSALRNSNLRSTDNGTDFKRDDQAPFPRLNGGKSTIMDPSLRSYLGRVSRNNDIIITSIPQSPSSSNSSSKDELLEELQRGNQNRRHNLQSALKSLNDNKGLPQANLSDSLSANLISQMNSSPDNIARRGELLISPAPKEVASDVESATTLTEREQKTFNNPKYVLALSPPIPTDGNETEMEYKSKYGLSPKTLKISSYLLDRHRNRERSPTPPARIPLSLSDRLDSDCSRLLSSKRDLIVERVIQPEHEKMSTKADLTPFSKEHSLDQGAHLNQKTDYNRFNGTDTRLEKGVSIASELEQSRTGALRLKQFCKSLAGANVLQMPESNLHTSLSFSQNENGRNELREKLAAMTSLHMDHFDKKRSLDPTTPVSLTSSSRPDNEHFVNGRIFTRDNSLHTRSDTLLEGGKSKAQNGKEKSSGDDLRKIPCDYCDHIFIREADLNDHVGRFHAGVKKYVCFVCHKRFKRKQSLENHALMIHGVSGSGAPVASGSGAGGTTGNDGVNPSNGSHISERNAEMTSREQMIMMMIEKGKAELAAGRRFENGDSCDN